MADIAITDLTTATDTVEGTGIFDRLMQSVELHIKKEYNEGRIKGTQYAEVYLGALQAVLGQSLKFLLEEQLADKQAALLDEQIISEQKKNEAGGLIDLEKQKLQEEIDLVIARTAESYENIDASRKRTTRENLLNSAQVNKVQKEAVLINSQNSELLLNGPKERALKDAQTSAVTAGELNETNKTNAEVALLNAREDEELAATTRKDAESAKKVLLMEAQTTGFKTDIKHKILKQMLDGYAVNLSISGTAVTPKSTIADNIDLVANDILDDVNSTVDIT